MTYVLELPWQTPPLSLNDRKHWAVKARDTAAVRTTVTLLLRQAKVPALRTPVDVELRYTPRDNRRRDRDNLVATFKPCVDAIVEHGVIPDDTAEYLSASMPVITAKGDGHATGRMWLLITEATV